MINVLMVVAQQDYQDHEYETPKKILEQAGVNVTTASIKVGKCSGKLGSFTKATLPLNHVNVAAYKAIIFVGGPGAISYQHDSAAHQLCQNTIAANKILAAICIAPTILAYAGVLKEKNATVWNGDGKQSSILEKNGAKYLEQNVVQDDKIITANGPEAAEKFGQTIVNELNA